MLMCLCDVDRAGGGIGQKRYAAAICEEGPRTCRKMTGVLGTPVLQERTRKKNALGDGDGGVGETI